MKNITLSAKEELIARARELARSKGSTLNEEFRLWLADFVTQTDLADRQAQMRKLIDQLSEAPRTAEATTQEFEYPLASHSKYQREPFNEREKRLLKRFDTP